MGADGYFSSEKGTKQPMWKGILLYSPFAFFSPALEEKYNAWRARKVGPSARVLLTMTTLFWCVSIIQGIMSTSDPHAFAAACCTLAATAGALIFITCCPTIYPSCWAAVHVIVHLAHLPTYAAVRTILLEMYTPQDGTAIPTLLRCIHELLLIFPHFSAGLVASAGIALPFLPQIVVQASILAASFAGHTWICTAPHGLSSLVDKLQSPVTFGRFPVGFSPMMSTLASCSAHLAFWEIQAGMTAVVLSLLQDVFSRRQFLAENPDEIGPDGARRAAEFPFGSMHSTMNCITLGFGVFACDALLVEVAALVGAL